MTSHVPRIPEHFPAGLETFFHRDPDAHDHGALLPAQVHQAAGGLAVCQEVVNDQYPGAFRQVLFSIRIMFWVLWVNE